MLHQAGSLAQKRYSRGLRLNYVESTALLSSVLLERIRDGAPLAELMNEGKTILGLNDVMEGVPGMLTELHVEGTFPDGTKLLTVHQPICREQGCEQLALYASGLQRKSSELGRLDNGGHPRPGELLLEDSPIVLNEGRESRKLRVTNLGDRPVQVGSHYPFFEANSQLQFDREKAYGFRLNIAAGTALRFEPGDTREVELVAMTGRRIVRGCNGLIDGEMTPENKERAVQKASQLGFQSLREGVIS